MVGHTKESHKSTRKKQAENHPFYHHPVEKIQQLDSVISWHPGMNVLEVFAGQGNLTSYYKTKTTNITSLLKEDDSFNAIYQLRFEGKKYDLIDIDSYGYPDKFFPLIFEMMSDTGYLVFTFPIVGVNALNGITEQHYITHWRSSRPTVGDVVGTLTDMALREWKLLSVVDITKIERIHRYVFKATRVMATDFCNVKNR